ncbi:hypothetical protein GGI23_003890, partial [Coemansia sp. RSA 2559]
MSDYSAWNQLFRLNPDTPQTPMLSSQELQEELALWGNAQFQLEPMNEDQNEAVIKHTSSLSPREFSHQPQQLQQRNNLHGGTSGTPIVSPSIPTDAWGLMSLGQSHQGSSGIQLASQSTNQAAESLGFMVSGATSAADFLSAITSQDNSGYQSQQQQQAAIVINGVPMLPLMTLPRQQQQVNAAGNSSADAARRQQKHTAIAPAPTFHQPSILPKGGVVASSIFGSGTSLTSQSAKMTPKTKATLPPSTSSYSPSSTRGSNAKQSDESVENDEAEQDEGEGDDDERKRTAVADKRRRNTAASARFRVKKKMREQALEQNAREMTAKAEALEKRVQELEMETRWLKSLITEKDPSALEKIHCPCHHPNGFEAADLEAA